MSIGTDKRMALLLFIHFERQNKKQQQNSFVCHAPASGGKASNPLALSATCF
jgi:hypothetical protein